MCHRGHRRGLDKVRADQHDGDWDDSTRHNRLSSDAWSDWNSLIFRQARVGYAARGNICLTDAGGYRSAGIISPS